VDEVAAQHVDADAMVHYGHACMSQYVAVQGTRLRLTILLELRVCQ
jgi:diphthamide biosynthesis enzyme Dph1/Dph2-like protein